MLHWEEKKNETETVDLVVPVVVDEMLIRRLYSLGLRAQALQERLSVSESDIPPGYSDYRYQIEWETEQESGAVGIGSDTYSILFLSSDRERMEAAPVASACEIAQMQELSGLISGDEALHKAAEELQLAARQLPRERADWFTLRWTGGDTISYDSRTGRMVREKDGQEEEQIFFLSDADWESMRYSFRNPVWEKLPEVYEPSPEEESYDPARSLEIRLCLEGKEYSVICRFTSPRVWIDPSLPYYDDRRKEQEYLSDFMSCMDTVIGRLETMSGWESGWLLPWEEVITP